MPRIYRSMKRDGDRPRIDNSKSGLGVVVEGEATSARSDLAAPGGSVEPGTGGMSVSPHWRSLPDHRIPKRLYDRFPRASGSNELAVWWFGDGEFRDGPLADALTLRLDSPQHGLVEPERRMTLEAYRSALAATRDQWRIEEETE